MRAATRLMTAFMVLVVPAPAPPAAAQEMAPEQAAQAPQLPPDVQEQFDLYREMGMDKQQALMMAVMGADDSGINPLLLMMMMDGEPSTGEAIWPLMLSGGMGQQQKPQPVVIDRGEKLIIVDAGRVYVVNLETMEIEGSVRYRGGSSGLAASVLGPVFMRAREKARQASCLSNVKQICLGLLMYSQDYDDVLAAQGANWVDDVMPYIMNEQIFVCPSRPDLPVGYALDERLIGASLAQVPDPAQTIIVFESNIGGSNPVGGPDDIPPEGVHNGGINCGFLDGHVKWLSVDEARRAMERDPFQ